MSTAVPPEIRALEARLVDAGLEVERTSSPERFGNRLLVFSGSGLSIRAVCDRDEWSLELSADSLDDWFLIDVWRSCVEGRELSINPRPLDDDVAFLTSNLELLVRLRHSDEWDRFVDCLYDAREARGRLMHKALFGGDDSSS